MKKIAVTQRLMLNDSYYELREGLDVQWGKLFKELNFLPIVLPIEIDFEEYFKELEIDGIILTGGNDLNILNKSEVSKKRDIFEKKLLKYAMEKDVPVLGICRGMQVIADYFGADFKRVQNQIAIKHCIHVNSSSKYFEYLSNLGEVNSFHNYAINSISEEMQISAVNENGIIKAIEHKIYRIFGQMWHSERENPLNKKELSLIKKFFVND